MSATIAAAGCAVSAPSDARPPQVGRDPTFPTWYQQGDLWLGPASPAGVNPSLPAPPSPWFVGPTPVLVFAPVGTSAATPTPVTIAGRRVDDASQHLNAEPRSSSRPSDYIFTFASSGCWELTATAGDATLTATVYVLPNELRPDIAAARQSRDAATPYPVPATCAATGWSGPEDRAAQFNPYFWIDGDGVSVRSRDGLLWDGQDDELEWTAASDADLALSGHALNDPSATLRATVTRRADQAGSYWASSIVFPAPGCWTVTASAGDDRLDATVYVYPSDCRPQEEGQSATPCAAPPA